MEQRILRSDYEGKTISHYGVLERSGRYPWGSGENPYQRLQNFSAIAYRMKKDGFTEEQIRDIYGHEDRQGNWVPMSIQEYRSKVTTSKAEKKVEDIALCIKLRDKGWSQTAIAERLGVTEGTVRNYLKPGADEKARQITNISDSLRDAVKENGFIDVGKGSFRYLGTTESRMNACIDKLKDEGYKLYWVKVKQLGTGEFTTLKVLCPPGTEYKDFSEKYKADPSIVKGLGFCSDDGGSTIRKIQPPLSIDRSRIFVRYDEDGGSERDGLIQLRPGVEDLDLMQSKYAQVRIAVDGKMYMKGMAIYDDVPDGYDIVYNVNKKRGTPDEKVFKPMYEKGEDEPFGASIRMKELDGEIVYQKDYIGKDGKLHRSALNIVNEEGDWENWSKTLASQFLSKQSPELAKKQLDLAVKGRQDEFDEIMSLTNPSIKRKLLQQFSESCDSDAVDLAAAAMPRQKTQVLIPVPQLKDNEVYAPNFQNGERVVLVRYPHAGQFESPELVVNNKQPNARKLLGQARDAIGINKSVADQMSGADFDGDNVLVLPNNNGQIQTKAALDQLKNFSPKMYQLPEDDPVFTTPKGTPEYRQMQKRREQTKQAEMGKVSNLITDMTIKGAPADEIARAVKHSMVVIDSVKHNLNWKLSEKDNGILELKKKYQGGPRAGASTIVSKSSSPLVVPKRRETVNKNEMTPEELKRFEAGEKIYRDANETYVTRRTLKSGEVREKTVTRTQKTTKMAYARDARELSSGTIIEEVYANYANQMKAMGNKARAALRSTPRIEQSPSAKVTYAKEIESLDEKLNRAAMNAPREREAQRIANSIVNAQLESNPEMASNKDQRKKLENKAMQQGRLRAGSNKKMVLVDITDREWEAIQAGAISDSKLMEILNNTDVDKVRERATPRQDRSLSDAQLSRIKAMYARGLTQAEIADSLGISTSVVNKAVA